MKIIRAPKDDRFAIIPNESLRDETLSFRSRGLLAYLISMEDGWNTSSDQLAKHAREGRDAIRTALRELEQAGYLERSKYRDEGGIWRASWVVHETPHIVDNSDHDGKPAPVNQRRLTSAGFSGDIKKTNKKTNKKRGETTYSATSSAVIPVDNFPPPKIENNEEAATPPLDITDPRKCVTHQGIEDPPPCHGCKNARERWEAHAAIKARELARARREHEKAMRRATEEDAARRRADPEEQAKQEAARAMARAVAKGARR